ncbi:DUF1240 domain-containing protein [Enterobacter cloacae]|jgi:hypothetical protein|uniref:DUF1240 domain-containing protein n=1 Tax=Enterobacter cloacae TaxID=550 RepID=UPI0006984E4B|nr:DUF1240 domain-containing protein [Enterobacter cloacae]ELV2781780.1 DUF1240 domain-containing protein [Enterobacter cloacae]MCK1070083.1 DUF1240 domain-containing protein [Enterobacter cloacae subsp. cloacae]MCK7267024.1 DUF1240 domain-containing protein [Enterobacter cloacae]MCZ9581179.1 DUF1240 domain-containing protein [Enterobacter cloacae]OXU39667.1 hypothetical protein BME83_05105 [Enterobacter cloacae subsp. cloacae]
MFEEKIRPFLAIVIIFGLCVLSIYLGNSIFQSYFSFEDSIVFSWLSIALIALPVVMIFPLTYFTLMIVKGRGFALKTMDNYVSYLKWSCIAILILGVLFSCLYPKKLLSKGYVRCNGVPSGWMAGTATRYVKDPSICLIN